MLETRAIETLAVDTLLQPEGRGLRTGCGEIHAGEVSGLSLVVTGRLAFSGDLLKLSSLSELI